MKITLNLILLGALLLIVAVPGVQAAKDPGVDIKKVEDLVLRLVPDVTVDSVSMSPVKGLYEVILNSPDRSKGLVYISSDMKHLIAGSILDMEAGVNLTEKRFMEMNRIDVASIPLKDAIVLGNPEAGNKVIVLDDPD